MLSERLGKAGELVEAPENRLALVDNSGTAYVVSQTAVIVWDAFDDGRTPSEVAETLAAEAGRSEGELKEAVQTIASQLQEAGLLVPVSRAG